MGYSLIDKIKMWLCDKLGHKHDMANAWEFKDNIHCVCQRCRCVESYEKKPFDPTNPKGR